MNMKPRQILIFLLFAVWHLPVAAQILSDVVARMEDGKVAVTYRLQSSTPVDIALFCSDDNGNAYKICNAVSGDLNSQTTGDKKIVWNCIADDILSGTLIFKVSINSILMVFVQGGTFTMGCTTKQRNDCNEDEKPAHRVTLSDFYIGKYEVTQAQWMSVMGNNPSWFKGNNFPVETVSWDDVQEFLKKLNAQTGMNYRLPTEAEWEYAARGGNQSKGYKYSGSNSVDEVAWYDTNSDQKTHEAGTKKANELGIYDMTGNVFEWCSDWYGNYSSVAQTNPKGPSSGSYRVFRGGSWNTFAQYVRVPNRNSNTSYNRYNYFGFRLARSSK
jgi:formylglycine-generating enzyme required for sulfatase activity